MYPQRRRRGSHGLHYNYYRDYHPETGRYLEPDPIGLIGGLNPYRYVRNDPINFVDPLGLFQIHDLWGKYIEPYVGPLVTYFPQVREPISGVVANAVSGGDAPFRVELGR